MSRGKHGMGGYVLTVVLMVAFLTGIAAWLFKMVQDNLLHGTASKAADVVRPGILAMVWTAATTKLGLRAYDDKMRRDGKGKTK